MLSEVRSHDTSRVSRMSRLVPARQPVDTFLETMWYLALKLHSSRAGF